MSLRRTGMYLVLALSVAVMALGVAASPAVATTGGSCADADTNSADIDLTLFDSSVTCVVNERRVQAGLPPLAYNDLLHDAAWIYATSMLSGRFYDHGGCLNGRDDCSSPIGRLRFLGYIRPGWAWIVGETLRGAHPDTATPNAVVDAWMESPLHRAELLQPRFRELGVASVRGITDAFPSTDGVTVAAEFGARHQRRQQPKGR